MDALHLGHPGFPVASSQNVKCKLKYFCRRAFSLALDSVAYDVALVEPLIASKLTMQCPPLCPKWE